jgi:hypothetical protein
MELLAHHLIAYCAVLVSQIPGVALGTDCSAGGAGLVNPICLHVLPRGQGEGAMIPPSRSAQAGSRPSLGDSYKPILASSDITNGQDEESGCGPIKKCTPGRIASSIALRMFARLVYLSYRLVYLYHKPSICTGHQQPRSSDEDLKSSLALPDYVQKVLIVCMHTKLLLAASSTTRQSGNPLLHTRSLNIISWAVSPVSLLFPTIPPTAHPSHPRWQIAFQPARRLPCLLELCPFLTPLAPPNKLAVLHSQMVLSI